MSLTSHLRDPDSPVAQFISQRFPQTRSITKVTNKRLRELTTMNPGFQPWVYSHLGRAIDYRIRYSFAITPSRSLVAMHGALSLTTKLWESDDDIRFDWDDVPKGLPISIPMPVEEGGVFLDLAQGPYPLKLILSFFDTLDATLQTIQPVGRRLALEEERLLARYCFVLGLFEEPYRSSHYAEGPLMLPAPRKSIEELLAIPEDAWVDDLCVLSTLFYDNYHHLLTLPHKLNPTFIGSNDVGGADADLIVNGWLIDIKATTGAKVDAQHVRQLVGYTLLDYSDKYHINSVGIYMARQGELFTWPVADFFCQLTGDTTASVAQLRQEFRAQFQRKQATAKRSSGGLHDQDSVHCVFCSKVRDAGI